MISDLTTKVLEQIKNETRALKEERIKMEAIVLRAERVSSELRELVSVAGNQAQIINTLSATSGGDNIQGKILRGLKDGMTIEEIAGSLDISVANARLLLHMSKDRRTNIYG